MTDSLLIRAAIPEDVPALAGLLDELGFPSPVDVVARRLAGRCELGETS